MFFIVKMVKKCRGRLTVVSLPVKRNIMNGDIEIFKSSLYCLKVYGMEYQDYIERTPRWMGLNKSRVK